jgi:hypothetical protein
MSHEVAEMAHRALEAFNRRDLDAFLALADDDIEFVPRIVGLGAGSVFRGHDGARAGGRSCSEPSLTSELKFSNFASGET